MNAQPNTSQAAVQAAAAAHLVNRHELLLCSIWPSNFFSSSLSIGLVTVVLLARTNLWHGSS